MRLSKEQVKQFTGTLYCLLGFLFCGFIVPSQHPNVVIVIFKAVSLIILWELAVKLFNVGLQGFVVNNEERGEG